jgi:hypothetical protein
MRGLAVLQFSEKQACASGHWAQFWAQFAIVRNTGTLTLVFMDLQRTPGYFFWSEVFENGSQLKIQHKGGW